MSNSRHMLAALASVAALSRTPDPAKRFDSIANPAPYQNKSKRAKVKFGKRVRRQRIKAKCVQRVAAYAAWVDKYRCLPSYRHWQHPQMRAQFEAASGVIG